MKDEVCLDSLTMDEVWQEIAESANAHNKTVNRRNNIRFKCIEKLKGKQFVLRLKQLLKDHECIDNMGFMNEFRFVRKAPKSFCSTNEYGRVLKGWFYTQQSVGDSGDCFEGSIYVEIKPMRYLCAPFSN